MVQQAMQKQFVFPFDLKHLQEIRSGISEMFNPTYISQREAHLIVLAVDEALAGIILHAKTMGMHGEVRMTVDVDDVRFKAVVEDTSNSFELSSFPESEQQKQIQALRQHQLGIFLIREIMDEVTYVYRRGFQNELEMVKFLGKRV
jgi:anti-sigma regulatory factor (Ser/Thr protein kinase)